MNFDAIINKPFIVSTFTWNTTSTPFTEIIRIAFPSAIFSNALAKVPFDSSVFYNTKFKFIIQLSGTTMHQGLLLAAAVPHGVPTVSNANNILCAPHVFLNASEQTSVILNSPMYVNEVLRRTAGTDNVTLTDEGGSDVVDLIFFSMSPLAASTGASTSLTIMVSCMLDEPEFFVPKLGSLTWVTQSGSSSLPSMIVDAATSAVKRVTMDVIDAARSAFRTLTGFHNPNIHVSKDKFILDRNHINNVDSTQNFEVLDNHSEFNRIYDDYYFRTDVDEMDLKHVLSKPAFLGTFTVNTTHTVGKLLMSHPIYPCPELGGSVTNFKTNFASPMRCLYESSLFWRGGLKLHIQSIATNFHFCKMVVFKNYITDKRLLTYYPSYTDIHNINTDIVEFSGGGQIQTIDLGYNSGQLQLPCTKDYNLIPLLHGMFYIYLVQPLVVTANVSSSIQFNIYLTGGDDLEFSGYAIDSFARSNRSRPTYTAVTNFNREPMVSSAGKFVEVEKVQELDLHDLAFKTEYDTRVMMSKIDEIYNIPEPEGYETQGAETLIESNDQAELLITRNENDFVSNMKVCRNYSMRDYLRRPIAFPIVSFTPTKYDTSIILPISRLLCGGNGLNNIVNSHFILHQLFFGQSGGLKIRLRVTGANISSAIYLPPGVNYYSSAPNQISASIPMVANANTGVLANLSESLSINSLAAGGLLTSAPKVDLTNHFIPFVDQVGGCPALATIFDIEIPSMNFSNFIGGVNKYFYPWDETNLSALNDFGHIVLSCQAATPNGVAFTTIFIEPLIGLSDDARLGFQCFAPTQLVGTVGSSPLIRRSVYGPPNGTFISMAIPSYPNAYFLNTA